MDLLQPFEELSWIEKAIVPENTGDGRLVLSGHKIVFFATTTDKDTICIKVYDILTNEWTEPIIEESLPNKLPKNVSGVFRLSYKLAIMTTYGKEYCKFDLLKMIFDSCFAQSFETADQPLRLEIDVGYQKGLIARGMHTDQLFFLNLKQLSEGFQDFNVFNSVGTASKSFVVVLYNRLTVSEKERLFKTMAQSWTRPLGYDSNTKALKFWTLEDEPQSTAFPDIVNPDSIDTCHHLRYDYSLAQTGPVPPHSKGTKYFSNLYIGVHAYAWNVFSLGKAPFATAFVT